MSAGVEGKCYACRHAVPARHQQRSQKGKLTHHLHAWVAQLHDRTPLCVAQEYSVPTPDLEGDSGKRREGVGVHQGPSV